MEVFLISFFSAIIIFITVFSIIKVLNIALTRKEISKRNYRLMMTGTIFIGVSASAILPFGYQMLFESILL
ncbi:hypothetical protein [Sediminibacillus massiliensis]|uniref:hypothetical protein n=1 Tax=Sediminibacillus massiliensis TaxID=1926277 RepID=UPI000988795B|nr:hypothetical protein [Sediminibacillus massiliensis]